jgi:hypothetical protein
MVSGEPDILNIFHLCGRPGEPDYLDYFSRASRHRESLFVLPVEQCQKNRPFRGRKHGMACSTPNLNNSASGSLQYLADGTSQAA